MLSKKVWMHNMESADADFFMVTRPSPGQRLGSQRARGPQEVREWRPERRRSSTQHERRVLARHGRRPGIRHSHHLSCGHVAIPTMGIQKICRSRSVNFFYSYLFTFIHSILICDASCKSNLAWYLCSLLKNIFCRRNNCCWSLTINKCPVCKILLKYV